MSMGGKLGMSSPFKPSREPARLLFSSSFPVSHLIKLSTGKPAFFVSFPVSHTWKVGNGNEAPNRSRTDEGKTQ
jgi:hypothetical protein